MRSMLVGLALAVVALGPLSARGEERALNLQLPVSPPPADVPARTEPDPALRVALKQYALQHVGLEDVYSSDDDGGGSYSMQPYVGKYHRLLEPDAFFELVGREDLASSYRTGSVIRTGLLVSSVLVWLGGGAVGVARLTSGSSPSDCSTAGQDFDACIQKADQDEGNRIRDGVLIEVGAALVGSGLLVAGLVYDQNPAPASEMRQLADEYNERLRARLGLPEDDERMGTALKILESMQVTPYANPNGGGLAVRGGF
ncbi:MAG: hypothetical protein JST54_09655 [Deltaproteobacteria bacterium]|nr:hypothetical protein [Deltaproteobacteria bacterium]